MAVFRPGEAFEITKEGEEAALLELAERAKKAPELAFVPKLLEAKPDARIALVGGIVRDAVMGIENKDYDLIAEGFSVQELIDLLSPYGKVLFAKSRAYGVIKFTSEGQKEPIDIAIPRTERYEQGKRRGDASVETDNVSIEDDFSRRDFTINALGLNLGDGTLIDPFGGLEDIRNRIIRAVGDPSERFMEDPTRILRGVRFSCRLGFKIDPKTYSAMEKLKGEILNTFSDEEGSELQRVSDEMIGIEMKKAIEGDPSKFLELFDKLGLLAKLLPEIESLKGVEQPLQWHGEGDAYDHTKLVIENIPRDSSLELKLAGLLHDIGKVETAKPVIREQGTPKRGPSGAESKNETIHFYGHDKVSVQKAKAILNRYHFTNKIIDAVSWLIENHMRVMAFPQMCLFKQKEMARNRQFPDLIKLSEADDIATVPTTGIKADFLPKTKEIYAQIQEEEKAGKPKEILNGREIIELLKQKKPDFDPGRDGKLIGELKTGVNQAYDEGEIKTKKEAFDWISAKI